MITHAEATAYFATGEPDEALQAYEAVKQILIQREILDSEAAPRKPGRPRGSKNQKADPISEGQG